MDIMKTTLKPSGVSQRSDWYRGTSVLEESADSSKVANGSSTFLQHLSTIYQLKRQLVTTLSIVLNFFKEKFPNLDLLQSQMQ